MADDPKTHRAKVGLEIASEANAPSMPTLQAGAGVPIPAVMPPEIPRYELGTEIARGGMGRVVEATDTVLGRVVALKEALDTDGEALRRFQREIRITARLEHPSIVPVHDAGTTNTGSPYYVMRKVSGRPLEKLVAVADTLGKRLALLPHVVAAAQAVAHAHSRGIIHRDIKPANILIGEFGETILIDWGLAKVIGEPDDPTVFVRAAAERADEDALRTRAGIVYGTPGFMAPEQLRGQGFDERVDVYALGATLYHLLARRPPHHAKTADAMMKAAITGPPPSLAQLVPGVPPELSTIVDKALAFDASVRYPNATALAEDLQRFLTGQLVASHHYSPREKVLRFLRKNRVPVVITGGALIVLAFVGVFSVRRIIHERDRADDEAQRYLVEKGKAEAEKAIAEERADELALTQARNQIATDPTAAVASVKALSAKRWRDVRSIGVAARAAGIAFQLPASPKTTTLELSRDGTHLLAGGDDGVVRLHDLARRTTRELAHLHGPVKARFADEDRRILVAHDLELVAIDPANNVKRAIEVRAAIAQLDSAGALAYWVDRAGGAWQLDLAAGAPVPIAIDEPVRSLAASPDGRWVALGGDSHLWFIDRTAGSAAMSVLAGDARNLCWAADSSHVAVIIDDSAVDLDTTSAPPSPLHHFAIGRRSEVAFLGTEMLVAGPTGLIDPRRPDVTRVALTSPVGVRPTRADTAVTAAGSVVMIISDDGDQTLHAPTQHVVSIEASPRSPYVIAVADQRLLVWNLDDIRPRRVTDAQPANVAFVAPDHILASFATDAPASWIDLASGHQVPVGSAPALLAASAAPSGRTAIAIDVGHRARLVSPGRQPQDLGSVDFARFVDDDHVALATEEGTIELLDLAANRRLSLAKRDGRLVGLTAGHGAVAAVFADGTVWHHDVASAAEVTRPTKPPPTGPIVTITNGDVVFAAGSELRVLRGDHVDKLATLARAIDKLVAVDAGVVAVTADGSAYVVTDSAGKPISVGPDASVSATGMIAVKTQGRIDVVDPIVGQRFTIGVAGSLPYFYPQISADARYIVASTAHGVLVWHLELPGKDEVAAWIDRLTNISPARTP